MSGKYAAYPEYKNASVQLVGSIPSHWVETSLKRYCRVTDGSHHSPKIQSDGMPFVSVTDVGVNNINFEDSKKITHEDYLRLVQEGCKPKIGDVLLTKDGTIGRAAIVAEDFPEFVILSSLGLLTPKEELSNVFLYYYLISGVNVDQMNSLIHGSALRRMTISKIDSLLITIPPVGEQEIIANFLDHETAKIDTLIEKQQQLIKLLKEKRQAVISHAVTKGLNPNAPMRDSGVEWLGEVPEHWEVVPIKYIVSTPVTDGPHETPEFLDEGVPFISAEAVSSGKIRFDKIRAHISEEDNERYSLKYTPKKYDIYMVKSGATTGITAIVETDHKFNIWSPLAVIRCKEDSYPYFVLNFMRSLNFKEAVELNWSFGTQQNIGMGVIENLHVTRPPLEEAKEISKQLTEQCGAYDTIIEKALSQIELMQERRTALISAAVTGKIDVRNWQAPEPSDNKNKEVAA